MAVFCSAVCPNRAWYTWCVQVNKMSLDENGDGDPLRFKLVDKTPGSDLRLLCQAASPEEKQNWVSQINNILKMQENFFKGKYKIG